jgi:hypothetical protein
MNGKYLQYLQGLTEMANNVNPFISSGAERQLEIEFEEITEYLELEIKDNVPKDEPELVQHFRLLTEKLQEFSDNKDQ